MRVVAILGDLIFASRLEAAAGEAGAEWIRVESPGVVGNDADLVLVDWSARQQDWAEALRALRGPRVILFGPHTDLEAHAAARSSGLGPMWARSRLLSQLPSLLVG